MKEYAVFMFIAIAVVGAFFMLGVLTGASYGIDDNRCEAIDNGVARWNIDRRTGRRYFEWISIKGGASSWATDPK